MRIAAWTEEEEKFLAKNYCKVPLDVLAKTLSRSRAAIKTKMSRMSDRPMLVNPWTTQEFRFLKENADKLMAKEIAAVLGRSTNSVLGKAANEGIKLTAARKRHSDEEVSICMGLHRQGMPIKQIAEKMEIPVNTLKCYLYPGQKGYRSHVKPAQ